MSHSLKNTDQPKTSVSRRSFLKQVAGGAAAVGTGTWSAQVAEAQSQGEPIVRDLSKYPVTDQYGKPFELKSLLGKPHILIFGYNGCQFCDIIGQNIGRIRENIQNDPKLRDIPVVVMNIHPEEDRNNTRDYVANYYSNDVWQAAKDGQVMPKSEADRRALGKKTYDEQKDRPAAERVLHLLFPSSAETAQAMQTDIGGRFIPNSPDSHVLKISVVDAQGVCAYSHLGTGEKPEEQQALVRNITQALTQLVKGRPR